MNHDHAQSQSNQVPDSSQSNGRKLAERWVSEAAYYIWEKSGHPHGHALDHWLHAEHEVRRLVEAGKLREQVR
jgi:hypothetical protein